jgi:sugar lactone lactonase YvrE
VKARWYAVAAVAVAGVSGSAAGVATAAPQGKVRVFAHIAAPGEPSLTLVTPQHRVFVGTFEDVEGTDSSPSKVFEYDASGKLLRTFVIKGQTPKKAHGVQVAARDQRGRLYVLDQDPARVLVLNPKTGSQRTYATFADVPTCAAAHRTSGCSNTVLDNAPEPDYAAWLPDGSMLVTDYAQALIWRVPPGGGKARVWLNDKRFDGELFGPAGIVLMPGHRSVLVTAATGGLTTIDLSDNAARGRLYRIELTRHFGVGKVVTLWSSKAAQAPDGFAVSADHRHVFIAMAGPAANCVVEVAHQSDGWHQVWQVPTCVDGLGSSPVPWDTATSVQFLGRSILVTNQAYFTDIASHWVVFQVTEPLRGMAIYVPRGAGAVA